MCSSSKNLKIAVRVDTWALMVEWHAKLEVIDC